MDKNDREARSGRVAFGGASGSIPHHADRSHSRHPQQTCHHDDCSDVPVKSSSVEHRPDAEDEIPFSYSPDCAVTSKRSTKLIRRFLKGGDSGSERPQNIEDASEDQRDNPVAHRITGTQRSSRTTWFPHRELAGRKPRHELRPDLIVQSHQPPWLGVPSRQDSFLN